MNSLAQLLAFLFVRLGVLLWPFMQATGPMHPVVADLGIPTVMPVGVGRPDNRIHAPNENIRIDDYLNTVRLMCRLWERFGQAG